jgi:hypothetical protein
LSYGQKQLSSNITGKNFFFELKPTKAWRAIFGLVLAIAISLFVGGPIAIITFPLGSLAVGWFLYRRYPLFYCSFVWWMWFVGTLIRRIIDLRCGYVTKGPWELSAGLVTAISILTLLKHIPKAHKRGGMPFIIATASCLYGYLINLINQGFTNIDESTFLLIGWLAPISFGFHLFIHWRNYPSYRQNIQRTFLWGVLFMGFYGIVQYVFAPPWDSFYLKILQATGGAKSFGLPEPFGIRVFSSINAPQDFATLMGAGLVLLFCLRGSQQLMANGLGYLSFLLSLARSGWLSWLLGTLVFFNALKFNLKIRMLIGILMTILIIFPVSNVEPFSTTIGERIESLSNTDSDGSLIARKEAFNTLLGEAMVQFVGFGLQSPIVTDAKIKSSFVIGDNGILVILFALGWMGALPYLLSLVHSIFQIQRACLKNNDLLLHATYAIILGTMSQIFFKSLFYGSFAMILWGFIGMGMSARNYYSNSPLSEIRVGKAREERFSSLS